MVGASCCVVKLAFTVSSFEAYRNYRNWRLGLEKFGQRFFGPCGSIPVKRDTQPKLSMRVERTHCSRESRLYWRDGPYVSIAHLYVSLKNSITTAGYYERF